MSVLVVAATTAEIEPLLAYLRKPRNTAALPAIDILITGVGLTATTWALTRQVMIKKPGLILQAGIAGSLDTNFRPGQVLAVKQEAIADQGVMESGRLKTVFDLGLAVPSRLPYSKGWLVNKSAILEKSGFEKVKAISVNEITTDPVKLANYRLKFGAAIESMEGAALHYVALMEKIPFLQLRAVSNYAGERDKSKWKTKVAITQLNKALKTLLK
jgi:futalosine hydrolase